MANQLRDIKADFVSFVDKSAVRDPRDSTKPRCFLLFKSESGAPGEGTPSVPSPAEATPDEREKAIASSLIDLETGRDRLRNLPPHKRPPGLLERIETAHAKLSREHGDLMRPGSAARAES